MDLEHVVYTLDVSHTIFWYVVKATTQKLFFKAPGKADSQEKGVFLGANPPQQPTWSRAPASSMLGSWT